MSDYIPNYRGNPFVEADKQSVKNKIYEGHKVFKVKTKIQLYVEEISGEYDEQIWTTDTFYFSHPKFDNLDVNEFKTRYAPQLIFDYYEGQKENGIVEYFKEDLTIYKVEKYDNSNINELNLRGEIYRVRMLKNIRDVDLKLVKNQCFFDYLCYKVVGKYVSSRKQLYKELGNKTAISMDDLSMWIKKGTKKGSYDKNISFYSWWENRRLAHRCKSNNPNSNTTVLNFMITDQHVIPIENDKLFTANSLKNLKTLTKNMKDTEADINWELDYHFNNYYYVDHNTYDKNKDAILSGTFKPNVEALIFDIRKKVDKDDENSIQLVEVGNKVMHKTKHKLSYVNFQRNMFKHPTSNNHQNFVFCEDFLKRKETCDLLFKKTKIINFKFNNQSWGEISRILMGYYLDNNEKLQSTFHPPLRELVDELCCKPLVQGIRKHNMMEPLVTWDINKCYTMAIVEGLKDQFIPIYHLGDRPEPFDIKKHIYGGGVSKKSGIPMGMIGVQKRKNKTYGKSAKYKRGKLKEFLYYIPTTVLQPYELVIREGIYPHILIQHLLDEKHISYTDIKYTIPCLQRVDANELVKFVENVYDLLKENPKYAKMIINVAVGLFNTKYENKSDEVMISASAPFTIAYTQWCHERNDKNFKVTFKSDDGDIDWIRTQTKKRKMKDNGVINQYVVASGLVRTLKMLKNKWINGMKLVGLKTDAIYLNIPDTITFDCKDCEEVGFQCRKCRKAKKPKPKSIYDLACEKDPVVEHHKLYDFSKVHPKFYNDVCKEVDKLWEECDNIEMFDTYTEDIEIPKVDETLDLIKKYPYKIEQGKKPPKYDKDRMDNLISTIGVVIDKDKMILPDLQEVDEDTFMTKLDDLETEVDEMKTELTNDLKIRLKNTAKNLFKVLIYGTAGSGKTTLGIKIQRVLLKIAKILDQYVIVTSYQRSCVNSWISNVSKTNKTVDEKDKIKSNTNWNWDTFYGNVLNEETGKMNRKTKCKIQSDKIFAIMIDEFFQMPERCLVDMCSLLDTNPDIIFIPIGDYNQMPGIESPKYNWLECDVIKNFVTHKLYKNYIKGSGRFSEEVLMLLRYLEQDQHRKFIDYVTKKKDVFENDNLKSSKWHICKYRKKKFPRGVIQINKKLCPKIEKNSYVICDKKYEAYEHKKNGKQDKKTKVPILVGEKYKVLATRKKDDNIECKIQVDDYGTKKYGWFPIKYKKKNGEVQVILSPANASTAFREQGREITEPYTIHNSDKMTKQTLIVSISRGKSKKGCLFKFSNLAELGTRFAFPCAYKNQKIDTVPGSYDGYKETNPNKPRKNEYQKNLLYKVEDGPNKIYVGEHKWNENKSLEENLNDRMKGHLNKNAIDKSPVLEFENPDIKPYHGNIDDEKPYYIYGKYKDILKIEKKHIQQMITAGYQVYNTKGTVTKPKIDEKKVEEYNVLDQEIQRMHKNFEIKTTDEKPDKDHPKGRKRYVIQSKTVAEVLGYKGDRVRSYDYDDIYEKKEKVIAKLCMVTTKKVEDEGKKLNN